LIYQLSNHYLTVISVDFQNQVNRPVEDTIINQDIPEAAMDFSWWIKNSASRIRSDGFEGIRWSARQGYYKFGQLLSIFEEDGVNIYDEEWDLLIIVDACRLDLMEEGITESSIDEQIDSVRSLGSMTPEWMEKNFKTEKHDDISNTAYVCGNPFSAQVLNPQKFYTLDEVWRYIWEEPGTVPPRAVTDKTIDVGRSTDVDKVIAHYMQPHCPFITNPDLTEGKEVENFGDQDWKDVWEKLRDNDISLEEAWISYNENLLLVLDEIEILLQNFEAEKVVISSDHGNAIGEYGIYGHPRGIPLNCLRNVPWIETSGSDEETHVPDVIMGEESDISIEKKLTALGYK